MANQVDHEHKAHGGLRFHLLQETAEAWPSLGFYQRFEQAVALVLTFLISGLIVVATAQLILAEVQDYVLNPFTPVSFTGFQSIFGMIMTVLVALELRDNKHPAPQRQHCSAEDRDSYSFARYGTEIHHHRLHRHRAARGLRARLCFVGARVGLLVGARSGPPRGRT